MALYDFFLSLAVKRLNDKQSFSLKAFKNKSWRKLSGASSVAFYCLLWLALCSCDSFFFANKRATGKEWSPLAIGYTFSRRFLVVTRFPPQTIRNSFSHRLHVFPRLVLVTRFPSLTIGYTITCVCHLLRVFPRLILVARFRPLKIGHMFSQACPKLHQCFPALVRGYTSPYVCI